MRFEATFSAAPGVIGEVRREMEELARHCGLSARRVSDVALAVSEVTTNVVVHAYRGEPGLIHVHACDDNERLTITIADEGRGMAPRLDSPGLGIGMAMVGRVADRVDVSPARPGTRIAMEFACPAP